MANGRCRLHGGLQPNGPAANNWKHGRYSKWAKCFGSRGKAIAEAAEDDDALNLRRLVAIFEIAMREAAARLDQNDTPAWRKRALELHKAAIGGGASEMAALGTHLAKGAEEDEAYALLLDRTERLHKAVTDTLDTMLRASNVLNRQQAEVFVRAVFDIVRGEVGPDVSTKVLARLDSEVMGGRLAVRGFAVETTP